MIFAFIDLFENIITAFLYVWILSTLPVCTEARQSKLLEIGFVAAYALLALIVPARSQSGYGFILIWIVQLVLTTALIQMTRESDILEALYIASFYFIPCLFGPAIFHIVLRLNPEFDIVSTGGYVVLVVLNLMCKTLLMYLLPKVVNLRKIRGYVKQRLILSFSMLTIWGYVRFMMEKTAAEDTSGMIWMTIAIYCLILIVFVLNAHMLSYHAELEENRRLMIANIIRFENEKSNAMLSDDILRLNHDLRNILIGVNGLADDNDALRAYLKSIGTKYFEANREIETGNDAMNSLLNTKLLIAKHTEVSMSVCVDFHEGGFVEPIDIFTIFGNAIDNALEAVAKVTEKEQRFVRVKAKTINDILVFKIENSYNGIIYQLGDRLLTTKENSEVHGIGFSSMKKALGTYNGEVIAEDQPEKKVFCLKIIIPLR